MLIFKANDKFQNKLQSFDKWYFDKYDFPNSSLVVYEGKELSWQAQVNFLEQCMYRNSKGKQQVQQLRSAVVNLPTFLSWFSFRDTNKFATETKQSLSNLSLCVFKIAIWLKRACNILDRNHVFFVWLLRGTSPLLHLSQDWRQSKCKQQWRGRSTVAGLAADLGPPSKRPERSVKGLAAWDLNSYLNLFVLMFCSFCFVFPSVSFLFSCFVGF